jgi:hypothetical protein
LPISPVTTSAAEPISVSAVLLASAVASSAMVSPAPLAVIEVAPEPVVIEIVSSAAFPVVTVNAPVSEDAAMSPINPVTTSAAEPVSVSAILSANTVAFTVTVSLAKLSVIEVAAEPVVIAMPLSTVLSSSHVPCRQVRHGLRAMLRPPQLRLWQLRSEKS